MKIPHASTTSLTEKTDASSTEMTTPDVSFPIVGIGASAGGLASFEAFFSGMPSDRNPDMAFVLVQHLSPDHTSALADIIQHYTRMKVVEVTDGMRVAPNCTYIIPPGYDMAFLHGTLHLIEPTAPRGQRLTIDFFFRSLAQDLHERSIGIILSGTGSDGSEGAKAIKAEGGMVIVQAPESAEYDAMPLSAIATGSVDTILVPSAMAKQLISVYAQGANHVDGDDPILIPNDHSMLNKIFILLRAHSGHDFSQYKLNTIHRRIERRLRMSQLDSLTDYVKLLQQTPTEVTALFQDLLIGVTHFFRDADVFAYLKSDILPKLFENKQSTEVIRLWSLGCSSGEEAYSLAILLKEYMEETKQHLQVQIFATDIDARAIAIARAGAYPDTIAADVSAERLTRFFIAESNGQYRVHKNIRDMLIFSEQNVIKDPPFSKIDVISCRNLLIYLNTELQKKLIPLFHYALNANGFLVLGSSESIGEFSDLFQGLNPTVKVFQRKADMAGARPSILRRMPSTIGTMRNTTTPTRLSSRSDESNKPSLRALMEHALLQQIPLSGALVNEQGDILYLHGRMGRYLELPSGEVGINNILSMTQEGLRRELTMALHKVSLSKQSIHYPHVHVSNHGIPIVLALDVRYIAPNDTSDTDMYLITLEVLPDDVVQASVNTSIPSKEVDARITTLEQELFDQEAFLQLTNRKLETSNEELRLFNEEMQSLNEELQSSNEELETSKEELQSLNEELSTVNAELQSKITDLSRTNNDMNNLLAGSNIGTVFIDHQLCIMRFTPAVTPILNLITSDIGRPIGHIVSNMIGYADFITHVQAVLDTLIPKEVEVQTREGQWYLMHIQPYRTLDNVIEGAVISFVDISEVLAMRHALQKANEKARLAVVLLDASDAITMQDMNGNILAWNPAAERLYGWTESEALQMNVRDTMLPANQAEEVFAITKLSQSDGLEPYRTQRLTKTGQTIELWIAATALQNEQGKVYAIATTERAVRSQRD